MVRENGMVMISENEYAELVRKADSVQYLRSATIKMLKRFKDNPTEDVELTRREFVETYEAAVDDMFENDNDDNEIYGCNATVHWHGLYCDCADGAQVFNYIISAIKDLSDEID